MKEYEWAKWKLYRNKIKNYQRLYSHLKNALQSGRAILSSTQFDETKSRCTFTTFLRGGFAVSVSDKIRPIVRGSLTTFQSRFLPVFYYISGSDLHTIPDQISFERRFRRKASLWKLGRYRRRRIFAFAMLSTSRDDAFSNNLRQYDSFWFVKDRKPGDREDGKASEGQLYPFRNALITYL